MHLNRRPNLYFAAKSQTNWDLLLGQKLPFHGLYNFGSVFGQLISSITEEEEGLMARDVLLSNPRAAEWVKTYCGQGLLRVIKDGFAKEEKEKLIDF